MSHTTKQIIDIELLINAPSSQMQNGDKLESKTNTSYGNKIDIILQSLYLEHVAYSYLHNP